MTERAKRTHRHSIYSFSVVICDWADWVTKIEFFKTPASIYLLWNLENLYCSLTPIKMIDQMCDEILTKCVMKSVTKYMMKL